MWMEEMEEEEVGKLGSWEVGEVKRVRVYE